MVEAGRVLLVRRAAPLFQLALGQHQHVAGSDFARRYLNFASAAEPDVKLVPAEAEAREPADH